MSRITDPLELFNSRFDRTTTGCWPWKGCVNAGGYGVFRPGGRRGSLLYAHRFAYELFRNEIPADKVLDHLCRNRACVNPDHLEVVTDAENRRRGLRGGLRGGLQTTCIRGHRFDEPDNTYVDDNGWRWCRKCRVARQHKRKQKREIA